MHNIRVGQIVDLKNGATGRVESRKNGKVMLTMFDTMTVEEHDASEISMIVQD